MSLWERWVERRARLDEKYGRKRVTALGLLAIAGLASLTIKLLIRHDISHTAMLYLAVPYLIAIQITALRPYREHDKWWRKYASHAVSALVVFLGSSVVLFEGFICVLFFAPIYFLFITIAFIAGWLSTLRPDRGGRTYVTAIPLLVALLSLEGTSELTTFDRRYSATATDTTTLSPDELLENLARPFDLPAGDDWMLGLFPMPWLIEAGSLEVGDVHRVHMRYHRWFVTNTHEGVIELRIDAAGPERVAATFLNDTSYLSTYVNLIGSEIRFVADANDATRIELTVSYERCLDPAWYFGPIQRHAIEAMAAHLIQEILIRDQ